MTAQTWIALALALCCGAYFIRDLLRSALGACGSCGSCKRGCPAQKLETVRRELDKPSRHPV